MKKWKRTMGGMKDYAHRLRGQQESGIDVGGLQGIAELLGVLWRKIHVGTLMVRR